MPADLLRYVVEKGSITVDGVSLTVVEALDDGFTVAVIPHTAGGHHPGRQGSRATPVNLEVDVMAKYAERLLDGQLGALTAAGAAPEATTHGPIRGGPMSPQSQLPRSEYADHFATIEDAVAAIGRGEIVVVVDDEDRENEGDLIMAAESATPEKIAFFVRHTSGVICAPLDGRAARRARHPADGPRQHRVPAHRVHLLASTTATARPPASRPPTAPPRSRR